MAPPVVFAAVEAEESPLARSPELEEGMEMADSSSQRQLWSATRVGRYLAATLLVAGVIFVAPMASSTLLGSHMTPAPGSTDIVGLVETPCEARNIISFKNSVVTTNNLGPEGVSNSAAPFAYSGMVFSDVFARQQDSANRLVERVGLRIEVLNRNTQFFHHTHTADHSHDFTNGNGLEEFNALTNREFNGLTEMNEATVGRINVKAGTDVTLRFSFFDELHLTPKVMDRFYFSFLEMACGAPHGIMQLIPQAYTQKNGQRVVALPEVANWGGGNGDGKGPEGRGQHTSGGQGDWTETTPEYGVYEYQCTKDDEMSQITFLYKDTDHFEMTLKVMPGEGGRNFIFTGLEGAARFEVNEVGVTPCFAGQDHRAPDGSTWVDSNIV